MMPDNRLIPFQEGMKVGFGYDLIKGIPLTSPAVQGTISPIANAAGQLVISHVVRITDQDTLHRTLGVNLDAGGRYFGASGDVKANYAQECNISTYSTHVLVGVSVVDAFESFDAPVLSPDAVQLLTDGAQSVRFRQRFGDVFIDGLRKGGEYFATFEIISVDEATREKIAVQVSAAFNSGVAAAHLETDIAKSSEETTAHTEVRVHVYQNGSVDHTDQTMEQILQKAHDFPPSVADNLAAPFAVSLADYNSLKLPNNSFNFFDIENQRDVLAEHARKRFEFLTLINDLSYIRRHPEDFVGSDDAKLKDQLAAATEAVNVMEKEASACLRDPGACSFTVFDISDFPLPAAKPGTKPPVDQPLPPNAMPDLVGELADPVVGLLSCIQMEDVDHCIDFLGSAMQLQFLRHDPRKLGDFFFVVLRSGVRFEGRGDPTGATIRAQFPPPGVPVTPGAVMILEY